MKNDNQNNNCGNDKLVALEEPEELRKLREENEELKKVAPASQAIKTTIEGAASKYFYCHALLSPGEVALIRALRKGEIVEVFYGDVCQIIVEVSGADEFYDALEKIKAEQEAING